MSLQLISADEILDGKGSELDWVIYPLAVKGSTVMIYARQGAGKSSICMQLADSLVTGRSWLGFEVRSTGPVIYLQFDMSRQEMNKLVVRASEGGLYVGDQLFISQPEPDEESVIFDVLRDDDQLALRELCERVRPVAVIVDTIHDAYEHIDKYKDVNALARRVLRRFKEAIGDAVLVFLNHQRKGGMMHPKRRGAGAAAGEEDDDDSFMGGQVWEGRATTSIFMRRVTRKRAVIKLKKVRLEEKPFDAMELEIDRSGFFKLAKLDYKQLLVMYPDHLAPKERDAEIAMLGSKADVFRRIAELTGEKYDTVRQQEHRHPMEEACWKKYVTEK